MAARWAAVIAHTRGFRWLVRAGFLSRGVTYGIIGAMTGALALGVGAQGADPNQQGALTVIGHAPLGRVLLIIVSVGLLAYALWKLGRAAAGDGPEGGGGRSLKQRVSDLSGGLVYLGFCGASCRIVVSLADDSASEQNRTAAGVLGWPGGQVIVGAAGAILIAISLYQIYDALRGAFRRENKVGQMGEQERRAFAILGRIGLTARSVVFVLVGYFLIRTAIDFKVTGLGVNGALARVHDQPYGPWLLALTAAGLLVFAIFSLFEARYQRL